MATGGLVYDPGLHALHACCLRTRRHPRALHFCQLVQLPACSCLLAHLCAQGLDSHLSEVGGESGTGGHAHTSLGQPTTALTGREVHWTPPQPSCRSAGVCRPSWALSFLHFRTRCRHSCNARPRGMYEVLIPQLHSAASHAPQLQPAPSPPLPPPAHHSHPPQEGATSCTTAPFWSIPLVPSCWCGILIGRRIRSAAPLLGGFAGGEVEC